MICLKCSTLLVDEANFCHHCGCRVADVDGPDGDGVRAGGTAAEADEPVAPSSAGDERSANDDDGESDVWQGRFSPKSMAPSFAVVVVVSLAVIAADLVAAFRDVRWLSIGLLVVLALVWVIQLARVARRYLVAHYRLTDRRLFVDRGFIKRHKYQLELSRVEDVRVRENVFERLLDVGSIEIHTSDRRLGRVVMTGIDDADSVAETIRSLTRARRPRPAPAAAVAKALN